MMGAAACLHSNCAWRQLREKAKKLLSSKFLAQYDRAIAISAMHLKNSLRQIQPDCNNLSHGRPPLWSATPPLWHTDAVGGVHPINLRTHKIDGVREAIAAVGATVRYLPAYSPDLNPIEMAFSKLKAALRKGAKRTVKELWRLIGKLVKSFVPNMCANYFRHAGYKR
jgi:hypothetical protein